MCTAGQAGEHLNSACLCRDRKVHMDPSCYTVMLAACSLMSSLLPVWLSVDVCSHREHCELQKCMYVQ